MPPRLLSDDVALVPLHHVPLRTDDVVAGSPTAAVETLTSLHGTEVGLWEMTEGTARDTEVDEVFVVLAGRGTVEFEDGERVDLRRRVALRLTAGERTVWTVEERLRKVWVA